MYKKNIPSKTQLQVNNSYKGETIEQKIRRIIESKEPVNENAGLIFTERHEGVLQHTNIRTDKWDAALESMNELSNKHRQRRVKGESTGAEAKKNMDIESKGQKDSKAE